MVVHTCTASGGQDKVKTNLATQQRPCLRKEEEGKEEEEEEEEKRKEKEKKLLEDICPYFLILPNKL